MSLRAFLVHLRLHYQLFILSGPYLCGGLLAPQVAWPEFLLQFANVHVLLFGGATAYNSFHDKDEGPIGGLRHPPRMRPWMHPASLALQAVGLALAVRIGLTATALYAGSMLLFWLYSTPHARWKGRPFLSFAAIGLSSGTAPLLIGRLAAAPGPLSGGDFAAAIGAAAMLLSLYPVSQLYQREEDQRRGDATFAVVYGKAGIQRSFLAFFPLAMLALLAALLALKPPWMAAALGVTAPALGLFLWRRLNALAGTPDEYAPIMRLKYGTSVLFVAIILGGIALSA